MKFKYFNLKDVGFSILWGFALSVVFFWVNPSYSLASLHPLIQWLIFSAIVFIIQVGVNILWLYKQYTRPRSSFDISIGIVVFLIVFSLFHVHSDSPYWVADLYFPLLFSLILIAKLNKKKKK